MFVCLRTTYYVPRRCSSLCKKLSLHVTGLSLFEASSNTWHVCDLLSH